MRKTKGSGSRSGKNWRRNLHQNRRSDVKFCSSFWRAIGSVGGQVGAKGSQSLSAGEGEATPARTLGWWEWVGLGQGLGQYGVMGRKEVLSPQSSVMLLVRNERRRESARTLILLPWTLLGGGKREMRKRICFLQGPWITALRKLSSSLKNKGMKEDKIQRLGRLEKDGDEQQLIERAVGAVRDRTALITLRAIKPCDSPCQRGAKSNQLQ